jgi:hypothetical protein
VTTTDLIRKRIAPIAFIFAIAWIARDACNKQDRTHATFVLDFGAAAADVRAVDAEIWVGNDQLATFHRAALANSKIGPVRFEGLLTATDGELRLDVDLGTAHKQLVRRYHADEGATITIPLDSALR